MCGTAGPPQNPYVKVPWFAWRGGADDSYWLMLWENQMIVWCVWVHTPHGGCPVMPHKTDGQAWYSWAPNKWEYDPMHHNFFNFYARF